MNTTILTDDHLAEHSIRNSFQLVNCAIFSDLSRFTVKRLTKKDTKIISHTRNLLFYDFFFK